MSTYLLGLARALAREGCRVDLFTRAALAGAGGALKIGEGVTLHAVEDGLGPLDKLGLYPHRDRIACALDEYCRRERLPYDMVFSHYWLSGCVGRLFCQNRDLPHLVMFHTLGRAKNEACPGENEPALRLAEEENLARNCDLVVVASRSERARVRAYFGLPAKKTVLIPCGIDRDLFRPPALPGPGESDCLRPGRDRFGPGKAVLYVGRIEPVKGLDLLVEAAGPAFKTVIVGGDASGQKQLSALRAKAAVPGRAAAVDFIGAVEHRLLPFYYAAADLTVLPSHYESLALVPLESLACGTPVLGGPVGVMPELAARAGNTGSVTIVRGRNPETWAAAIGKALGEGGPLEPSEIDRLLRPYNWENAARLLIRQCLNLLPSRPHN